MKTHSFRTVPVIGENVIVDYTNPAGSPIPSGSCSGIYLGVARDEETGQPYHYFRDGEINGHPQACHGFPAEPETVPTTLLTPTALIASSTPEGFRRVKFSGPTDETAVYDGIVREGAERVGHGLMPFVSVATAKRIVADVHALQPTAESALTEGHDWIDLAEMVWGWEIVVYNGSDDHGSEYDPTGYPVDANSWGTSNLMDDAAYAAAHPGDEWLDLGAVGWIWEESEAEEDDEPITTGDRVRAIYPNSSWGEGEVIATHYGETLESGEARKPLTVRRDDGVIGYFATDQVATLRTILVHLNVGTTDDRSADEIAAYLDDALSVGMEGHDGGEALTVAFAFAEEI